MAKDKKDLLIQLLPACLTDELFNEYRCTITENFKKGKKDGTHSEKKGVKIPLKGKCFGISLNTTIISKKPIKPGTLKQNPFGITIDDLDNEFFEKSKLTKFERSRWCKPIVVKLSNYGKSVIKKFTLFVTSTEYDDFKKVYIKTFTLTTFDPYEKSPNYVSFSNIEVINLSKQCAKIFNDFEKSLGNFEKSLDDLSVIEVSEDSGYESMDDTFRSIQFWGNPAYYDELNDDARDIIKSDIYKRDLNNLYYFYSIVTNDYKAGLLRRHYENIVDVVGHCQSASKAYFDIFYGNVCLEVTIKPKDKTFGQIGHDSEEFRIWEILAFQKYLAKNTLKFGDSEDAIFDFSDFTKKLEKGGSWIDYAKYLQNITGIEYYYKKRKREFEIKERENERALQKLNILIIISIFISLVSFFLTPIYSSIGNYSKKTFFDDYIYINYHPEVTTLVVSLTITAMCFLLLLPRTKEKWDKYYKGLRGNLGTIKICKPIIKFLRNYLGTTFQRVAFSVILLLLLSGLMLSLKNTIIF